MKALRVWALPTVKSKAAKAVLTHPIIAYTIIGMKAELTWDETKRQSNLIKHGLDFADAEEVLESVYRLDLLTGRNDERHVQSISYALGFLAVLTVVYVKRDNSHGLLAFAAQAVTKERCTMTGSKTNTMSREEVLAAIRNIPESANFVWDGIDEDDRPATKEELLAGIVAMETRRGRPSGSDKTQIALRVDNSVLSSRSKVF